MHIYYVICVFMYIESVPNRNSPPAILLRESYRENGKVKKRTLANLSKLPGPIVAHLRVLLRGGSAIEDLEKDFEVIRSLPHGHVAAVLGTLRKIGLDLIIGKDDIRQLAFVLAMITARIINPCSKLATARGLDPLIGFNTLAQLLNIENADADDLYGAMDWLLQRQEDIENALADRHLKDGTLVFYDVTSTYFEGRTCPLAQLGHSRDDKKDKLQIVIGLLCAPGGCPIAVEVFEGNTADPRTLKNQITKITQRFGIQRVVLVGDRGMITQARIRQDLTGTEALDWITALRSAQIAELVQQGTLQLSLFDTRDMAEIVSPDYPNERLIVCRNPYLADERARKREDLLKATEKHLGKIVAACQRKNRPLKGAAKIGLRVGKVLGKFKMAKHFCIRIEEDAFFYHRDQEKIAQEAALDGIYVIRTSVAAPVMDAEKTVAAYKQLSDVERAFRSIKSIDLKVRPIYHRLSPRVKAHVFLCMLAYYVEWHMRQALAPMLFDDHEKQTAQLNRKSIVAPAQRSEAAIKKVRNKRCVDRMPVHSFRTLLEDLNTICKNTVVVKKADDSATFEKITQASVVQQRALDLLGINIQV